MLVGVTVLHYSPAVTLSDISSTRYQYQISTVLASHHILSLLSTMILITNQLAQTHHNETRLSGLPSTWVATWILKDVQRLEECIERILSWQSSCISLIPNKKLIKPCSMSVSLCQSDVMWRCSFFLILPEKNAIRNKSSKIGDVIFWLDNVGTINTDKQTPLQPMIRRSRL